MTRWLGFAGLVIILDQLTKWLAQQSFSYAERLSILPIFDLTLLYNRGAAFSFLASGSGWQRWLLILIAVAASILIIWMMTKHLDQRRFVFALSLILGGAIGNLIDRVVLGHVVDFLLLHWRGWYYPAFNLADMAITFGAILIIYDEWARWRQQKHNRPADRS